MLQLTAFRHAKAVPADDSGDDFDRALAQAGRDAAPKIAAAIVAAGAQPELALVSDARRTRETWELAAASFPGVTVRFLTNYYLAPAETLYYEAERSGAGSVLIVAHNPGLHEMAARLDRRRTPLGAKLRAKLPTAGAALFNRKAVDSSWKLDAYITPKMLGGSDD